MQRKNKVAKLFFPLIAISAIVPFAVACSAPIDPDPPAPTTTFLITYNINASEGEHIVKGSSTEIVNPNTLFGQANAPVVAKDAQIHSYILEGWSLTPGGTIIDPSYQITQDTPVYPIWQEMIDEQSSIMAVDKDNNKYFCDATLWTDNEDTKIHLDPYESAPEVDDIPRDEFNNYSIEVGNEVQYLPDYFLCNCTNFNESITFLQDSQLVYIGLSFMSDCQKFNQELTLPTTIKCIHNNFMGNCETFNKEIQIPNQIQIIGRDFLSDCYAFNQNIAFSSTIDYLGEYCMFNCDNFQSTLTMNTPMENVEVGSGASWASQTQDAIIATEGFTVDGDQVAAFISQFPTQQGSEFSFWRKIKNE